MNLKGKTILVTGADGFIGSHLTEELVRRGYNTRAFVMYNSFNSRGWLDRSPKEIQNSLDVVAGDIRDPHGVKVAMQGCDIVMHLAAVISIPFSYVSPDTNLETNAKGTLNVVQAARELGVEKVVHTSTSEVYGTARIVPITEDHPLQAQSPYSASKIAADQISLSFHASFGTPVSVVRPFNTYGPRQSARAIIPTVISQINAGLTEIRLGSLHPTRDFSFISDTVAGFIAVAESERTLGEVVNLGSGFEVSIGDTVKMIADIMGKDINLVEDQQRIRPEASEVERLWADTSKVKSLTDWQPTFEGLDGLRRGLVKTIDWFSDPENASGYKTEIYNI